jgi:hypothetical protein
MFSKFIFAIGLLLNSRLVTLLIPVTSQFVRTIAIPVKLLTNSIYSDRS